MDHSRIIVTSSLSSDEVASPNEDLLRYVEALYRAGAEAVVVPKGSQTARALQNSDIRGVVFSGGGDVNASRYGGNVELCTRVDEERDAGEIALFREAYFNNVPILAICRGMQIANVALGGSLLEDIPNHHNGRIGPDRFHHMHDAEFRTGSRLAAVARRGKAEVNSVHHQAIRELVPNFVAVAHSADGVIEAIEAEGAHPGFFIGVQWHPEALSSSDALSRAIFQAFVVVCQAPDSVTA